MLFLQCVPESPKGSWGAPPPLNISSVVPSMSSFCPLDFMQKSRVLVMVESIQFFLLSGPSEKCGHWSDWRWRCDGREVEVGTRDSQAARGGLPSGRLSREPHGPRDQAALAVVSHQRAARGQTKASAGLGCRPGSWEGAGLLWQCDAVYSGCASHVLSDAQPAGQFPSRQRGRVGVTLVYLILITEDKCYPVSSHSWAKYKHLFLFLVTWYLEMSVKSKHVEICST